MSTCKCQINDEGPSAIEMNAVSLALGNLPGIKNPRNRNDRPYHIRGRRDPVTARSGRSAFWSLVVRFEFQEVERLLLAKCCRDVPGRIPVGNCDFGGWVFGSEDDPVIGDPNGDRRLGVR